MFNWTKPVKLLGKSGTRLKITQEVCTRMLTHLWGSSWQLGWFQLTPCAFQVWALAYFVSPDYRMKARFSLMEAYVWADLIRRGKT